VSQDACTLLHSLFDAALGAADPAKLMKGRLPAPPNGKIVVVGAGKAAAAMAAAFEREWSGRLSGLVVTPYGHAVPCSRVEVTEAAHPVPDSAGLEAAHRILEMARSLTRDDLLVCLISGGGSALLVKPAEGISLEDKRTVNTALLRSGATIAEMNSVRKHLSAIKGGRLAAAAHPARVVTLLISDVPGDDPSVIASGPTVPDPTTREDAWDTLTRRNIDVPASVRCHLTDCRGISRYIETPKPGDEAFAADELVMLATARTSLEAAATRARASGVAPLILGDDLEGEARDLGSAHAALARACAQGGAEAARAVRRACAKGYARSDDPALTVPDLPLVILSGGETTVTVRGRGRGGRNAEYLLAVTLALDGHPGISSLACDTDGIDGSGDNAGAIAMPDTLLRARDVGLDPQAMLTANDAYTFFASLEQLIVTGPTRTNVNDFRAILVDRRE